MNVIKSIDTDGSGAVNYTGILIYIYNYLQNFQLQLLKKVYI